jgi:hypothetical protein
MMVPAALVAVLGVGLVACSDDSGDDTATPEAAGVTTTTAAAGLDPAICESVGALNDAVIGLQGEEPTPEFLEGTLLPAINDVVTAGADDDTVLGPALEVQGLIEQAVDGTPIDDSEITGPYNAILAPTHDGCGYQQLDVTAVNYAFEGVPDSLDAGTTSLALTNDADEMHEMVLFRRADGETRSVDELLALPQGDPALEVVTAAFVQPGETGYTTADLEAGGYIGVCFLPVGGAEDGPPHFTEGMVTEFEVA